MNYNEIKSEIVSADKFEINLMELRARLGYDFSLSEVEPYIKQIKDCALFKYAYRILPLTIENSSVRIGETTVVSTSLSKVLHGCRNVVLLAVTTDTGVDRAITRAHYKSSAECFILDAVASAYIESFADYVDDIISQGLDTTKRFSPGYSDFPLEYQVALLEYLDAKKIGIDLTDKLLMVPTKSITAVLGVK